MMTMTLAMTMTALVKMMMSLRGLRCTNPIYLINSADRCCLSPRQLELELIFKLVAHYLVEQSCLNESWWNSGLTERHDIPFLIDLCKSAKL